MKFQRMMVLFIVLVAALVGASLAFAGAKSVTIAKPNNNEAVGSPVEVCMTVMGVTVEPAKKGVNPDRGHHHLLIDTALPHDLSRPIGKDAQHVHMGDGSTCKKLKLSAGKHTIRALFANGQHVPYSPEISDTITITVK